MTIATMLFGTFVFSPIVGFGLGVLVDSVLTGIKRDQFRRTVVALTHAQDGSCYCAPSRQAPQTPMMDERLAHELYQAELEYARRLREQDYQIAQRNRQQQSETIQRGQPLRGAPLYPLPKVMPQPVRQPAQLPAPNTVQIPQPHRDTVDAESTDGIHWFTFPR